MPRKRRIAASKAARKGWETRRKNQRRAVRQQRQRTAKQETEKRKIERLLGEDFDTLREARAALKDESGPPKEVDSADQWDQYYDEYGDYEDGGEIDAGVDY